MADNLRQAAAMTRHQVITVKYEDLAHAPLEQAMALFRALDIPWRHETGEWVLDNTAVDESSRPRRAARGRVIVHRTEPRRKGDYFGTHRDAMPCNLVEITAV